MTTINHRNFRNVIRNIEGYRALSDAIRGQIEMMAPKTLDTEAAKQEMLGLDALGGAYLAWVRVKREAIRSTLWTEAAKVISGEQNLAYANAQVYGAALVLAENQHAVNIAKVTLAPQPGKEEEEEEIDEEIDA